MKLAVALGLVVIGLGWWALRAPAPQPALIAGLVDEGLRGAPCPARSLYEQDARKKQGVQTPTPFARRLSEKFPPGSPGAALSDVLRAQGFESTNPCANDDSVRGARWRGKNWGDPDAYVYWRVDLDENLIFLDGHISRAE
jgi:hypothetical protein